MYKLLNSDVEENILKPKFLIRPLEILNSIKNSENILKISQLMTLNQLIGFSMWVQQNC